MGKNPNKPTSSFEIDKSILQTLVDGSAELVVINDIEGVVTFISRQSNNVLGYPQDRFMGKQFTDIIHPEDLSKYQQAWQDMMEGKPFKNFEYRIIDANGETRWLSHSAKKLVVDGRSLGIQNNIQNTTDRKISELKLQASSQFNEVILNVSPHLIYVYDIVEKYNVYSNNRIETLLGYSTQEVQALGAQLIPCLMHPDDFKIYLHVTLPQYQTLSDGDFLMHEYRMRHKLGHWCWLSAKESIFSRTDTGEVKQIFGLISDVTKRREHEKNIQNAQKALKESENKYRRLFENMDSAFALHEIATDKKGIPVNYKFLEVNEEFEKMTGIKGSDIIGRMVTEALPGVVHDSADWIGRYGRVALSGETLRFIHYVDTLKKWYAIVAYSPAPRQFATIFMDITEQKQLEAHLQEAEKMQAIGQLAGGIAHDFNNQLAGIIGYADLLVEDASPDSTVSIFANKIILATKRAADLTAQLLAFARKGKYLSVSVNLRDIISETVGILQHSIDNKQIRIVQMFSADEPVVIGDPSQLKNAVMNLAINARDAMPDGGEIRIATQRVTLDETYCLSHTADIDPGEYIEISVTDSGCGMEKETRAKMFEPFFTTKELHKGTGMGLAAVYGTITNHGGTIDVYSEPNIGTTIRVYLPCGESVPKTEVKVVSELETGSANVLLVDDEPMVIETCSAMLERLGYSVQSCQNGQEALTLFESQYRDIDVVILDMVMPEMDGRTTHQRLRKIKPEIVVLLSSGFSLDGMAQDMLKEGVNGFLQKPFRMPELSQKLAELSVTRAEV